MLNLQFSMFQSREDMCYISVINVITQLTYYILKFNAFLNIKNIFIIERGLY